MPILTPGRYAKCVVLTASVPFSALMFNSIVLAGVDTLCYWGF